jgi:hypothetical protein
METPTESLRDRAGEPGVLWRKARIVNTASQVKRVFWLYTFLVIVVTILSWSVYRYHPAPDFRPVFSKDYQFRDLTDYIEKTRHLYHGAEALGRGFPIFNYAPPGAFVFKALLHTFPDHPVRLYLVFLALCILGFGLVAWLGTRGSSTGLRFSAAVAIATTVLLGYPLWFTADRGNTEGVVWALSGAGLCFLLRARYRTAAILLGLASSIKPFSLVFLLLLLRRHRYKEASIALLTAGLAVSAAIFVIGPNPWKTYQDLKPGMSYYKEVYVTNLMKVGEARFTHSLLDGMKSAALSVEMGGIHPRKALSEVPKLMNEPDGWHVARRLAHIYPFIVITGIGLVIAVFYRKPVINQLTALAVLATVCPPVSGDYTLLHLYVPFGALLIFLTREVAAQKAIFSYSRMLMLAVIYGLLFAPLTFLRIYAGDAKLLLLLALLFIVARSPMRSAYFGDSVPAV